MRKAVIISDCYNKEGITGVKGKATEVNSYGNVMFYPNNKTPFYRICLEAKYIKYEEEYGKENR